jgi:hypothetical protein
MSDGADAPDFGISKRPGHAPDLIRGTDDTFASATGAKRTSIMSIVISDADLTYFERRAEAELELAQAAQHPRAVRAHYLLAAYYLDRVYGDGASSETATKE